MTDVSSETITVSSTAFGLNVEENDIAHTLYYLNTPTGAGAMPTPLDSVYLRYEGFRLDNVVFDSNTGAPVWLDLQGTLSQLNPGTIQGFKKGFAQISISSTLL